MAVTGGVQKKYMSGQEKVSNRTHT